MMVLFFRIIRKIYHMYVKTLTKYWDWYCKQQCCAKEATFLMEARVNNHSQCSERINIGKGTFIRGTISVYPYSGAVTIGQDCYVGEGTKIWSEVSVVIGNRVLISHNVDIHDCNDHPIDSLERHNHYIDILTVGHLSKYDLCGSPIIIEDDAWVGFGACIMKGVHIGAGAIVAANAVVTKNVPPHVVVAGNPARIVKKC